MIKTIAYQNNSGKTTTYSDEPNSSPKTVGYETGAPKLTDRTEAHNLGIGDRIMLKEREYEIEDIISGDNKSLEGIIYRVVTSNGKEYALKLYYKFTNPKDEPNPEALKRIKEIDDPDILKLYDFGTGVNKFLGKFCFEICDYGKGSDLLSVSNFKKKYTVEFLRSNVIDEIFKGIRTLHKHKIYHCDLKPQNVFYLDSDQTDLVIGDYGAAKTFEETSESELSHTSFMKGTDFYVAPEQVRGIVSEKNDYYSFGMIIVHLAYPEMVNWTNFKKIIERQMSKKPIVDYDPQYGEINDLIAGLTLYDINLRWGEDEVNKWLNGENVELKYSSDAEVRINPIKLGKFTIQSIDDLIEYVENNSQWYDYLIEDSEGYRLLLQFVYENLDLNKKKIFDKLVRTYQQDGKAFLKQCILRYFKPSRPLFIDMKSYDFWNTPDIKELAEAFFTHLNDISKITTPETLKLYAFQFEFILIQIGLNGNDQQKSFVRDIISKISSVLSLTPELAFEDCLCHFYVKIENQLVIFIILYALNPSLPLKLVNEAEISHPNDMEDIISTKPDMVNCLKDVLYDGRFEVWFRAAFPDRNQDQTFIFKCRHTYKEDKMLGIYALRWNFKPSLPFPFGNRLAKDPRELALLVDKSPADKDLCIKLLSNGWIRTWLTTIGYLKDTTQFNNIIKADDKDWNQKIEAVLHLLDPALPWPEVSADHEHINLGRVNIENSKTVNITVKNMQRGFLAGNLFLDGTGKGFSINKSKIEGDSLAVALTVKAKGLPVGSTQKINLVAKTNGGNLEIPVSYKVSAPVANMAGRSIGVGLACAVIFAIYRLILQAIIPPHGLRYWYDWNQIEALFNQPIIILWMILLVAIIVGGVLYFVKLGKFNE